MEDFKCHLFGNNFYDLEIMLSSESVWSWNCFTSCPPKTINLDNFLVLGHKEIVPYTLSGHPHSNSKLPNKKLVCSSTLWLHCCEPPLKEAVRCSFWWTAQLTSQPLTNVLCPPCEWIILNIQLEITITAANIWTSLKHHIYKTVQHKEK